MNEVQLSSFKLFVRLICRHGWPQAENLTGINKFFIYPPLLVTTWELRNLKPVLSFKIIEALTKKA